MRILIQLIILLSLASNASAVSSIISGSYSEDSCHEAWRYHAANAKEWITKLDSDTEIYVTPNAEESLEIIGKSDIVYEVAHGGVLGFTPGCDGSTVNPERIVYSGRTPKLFFAANCNAMCNSSHNITMKNVGRAVVGYCEMGNNAICGACLKESITWQTVFFRGLVEGLSIHTAYAYAMSEVEECKSCIRISGDIKWSFREPVEPKTEHLAAVYKLLLK